MNQYIFGPVPSRRLGRSLGIDLLPFKTCTYNCVYCECGPTTRLTAKRREYYPTGGVLAELTAFLSQSPPLDFVTFSGSGEPTLSLSIGEVIRFLKDRYPRYRIAVLTNGSLLGDPDVRRDLSPADVVLPTLSTVVEQTFRKIHRPFPKIFLEQILRGLVQFRNEYAGEIWVELFIIPGVNTSDIELTGLRKVLGEVNPDRIQLNTLDRPGIEDWLHPADRSELERVQTVLGFPTVETIKSFRYSELPYSYEQDLLEHIHEMLKRRPCTIEDIASATGLHKVAIVKILRRMVKEYDLQTKHEEQGNFYYFRN